MDKSSPFDMHDRVIVKRLDEERTAVSGMGM
jgi:co-chaperonin GroES (HSP10)